VLGPDIGGRMSGISLTAPFYFAGAISTIAVTLVWAMVSGLLADKERTATLGKIQGPQLGEMWKALFGPIGFLLFLAFLHSFALANFVGGVFSLYHNCTMTITPRRSASR
jgi:hypothetical protein